jgi:CBS domain
MTWTVTGTVDDLYRPGPITAAVDDSLDQIADRLRDKDVSALVILDGYRLAGIITERDIVRAVADRRDLADGTAGDYMTLEPATVGLETPLAEVAPHDAALGRAPPAGGGGRRGPRDGVGQGSAGTREHRDWLTRGAATALGCSPA